MPMNSKPMPKKDNFLMLMEITCAELGVLTMETQKLKSHDCCFG